jgi:hypothetical protein
MVCLTRSGDLEFFFYPYVLSNLIKLFSMSFSKVYSSILSPFVEKYQEAKNQKGRSEVLKNAADAVLKGRELVEEKGLDLPKDLTTVCVFIYY